MDKNRLAHRMGTAEICFLDEMGKPLSEKKVSVKQVTSAFLPGCGAFDSLPLTSPGLSLEQKEFFRQRMEKWTGLFNYGTLPFYWGMYEPTEGDVQEESRKSAARFLTDHGAKVKGHPLCWHTECAKWLMEYDNKTILEKQLERIHRDVTAFKGLIDIWDVINEVVIMPVYDRYDNAITRICKELGRVRLIKEVFEAAKAANPEALLLINDFNLSESYRILIDGCLNAGVPIGAIGIQTHQHQGYRGAQWLEDILERYSFFGLPLHFTENTLLSGQLMPGDIVDLNDYQVQKWPSTPEGEERQAREWKEMLEILFAHPLVEAVTGWDFADGAWLNAPSGLIRKDNTEKPAYQMLKRLFQEAWRTQEEVSTGPKGRACLTGFLGGYEATYEGRTASFELKKDSQVLKVVL